MKVVGILLLDSFRMLRAQRLFWVVLVISGLVALAYVSIGFGDSGYSVLFGLFRFEHELLRGGEDDARQFYLLIFTNWIVPWWFNAVAVLLALLSCASIVPEFVRKGSVDLFLSKPPKRSTLFFGKFLGGLLFVFLQIGLFAVIVFFGFGLRFGEWNLTIFWSVPVVVFVFTMIYSVHVFIATWTGSTVFGILAALLIWGVSIAVEWCETMVYVYGYLIPQTGMEIDWETGETSEIEPVENAGSGWVTSYRIVSALRTPAPKTRSMALHLKNSISTGGEGSQEGLAGGGVIDLLMQSSGPSHAREAARRMDLRHSWAGDVVSSAAFACFFLGLATVIFCRKDY